MSTPEEQPTHAELEQVNSEMKTSVRRCRQLLTDCRTKLAANGNDPEPATDRRSFRA